MSKSGGMEELSKSTQHSADGKNSAPMRLPQVDKLLRHPALEVSLSQFKRDIVLRVVRDTLEQLRSAGRAAEIEELAALVNKKLLELSRPSLRKILNGTGVVLNTNLGRAPISSIYIDMLKEVASGYCNLEINLATGKRGKRSSRLESLLNVLAGAESALAVNNNAAAIVLAVNCFARNKEVIVSRGELIEIGGSFRLPDVIESAGARLREVGTTNKTRLADFEKAIGPETGLVMRCHRSNFEIKGFTEETSLEDLVRLCRDKGVPVLEDLGSGVLMDLSQLGIEGEPTVEEVIATGCDLVTFSGDKLLGGPQAGLIAGKKSSLEKLAKHPLYRALRLDKVSISLLEQTLCSYLSEQSQKNIPALKLIASNVDELGARVSAFIGRAEKALTKIKLEAVHTSSTIGGGSLPGKEKASRGIALRSPLKSAQMAQALRDAEPPVIVITRDNDNIIDFRTILADEEELLLNALQQLDSKI